MGTDVAVYVAPSSVVAHGSDLGAVLAAVDGPAGGDPVRYFVRTTGPTSRHLVLGPYATAAQADAATRPPGAGGGSSPCRPASPWC